VWTFFRSFYSVEWVDYPVCSIHHEEREKHEEILKNGFLDSRSSIVFVLL
jgi:hypothetical protein